MVEQTLFGPLSFGSCFFVVIILSFKISKSFLEHPQNIKQAARSGVQSGTRDLNKPTTSNNSDI